MNLKGKVTTFQLSATPLWSSIYCGQYSLLHFMDFSELVNFYRLHSLTLLSSQLKCSSITSDLFRRGITIQILSTGSSMCRIRVMTLYSQLVKNNNATTPVRAGRLNPLTQQQLNKVIRHLLQQGEINQKIILYHIVFKLVRPLLPLPLGYQLG